LSEPLVVDYAASDSAGAVGRPSRWLLLAAYGSLLLLAWAVYAPTLTHEFVWDDHEQVKDNLFIRDWSNFPEFWKKDILALSRKGGIFRSNYYRPLFYTQYLIYYQCFELNTYAWHALAIMHHFFAGAAVLFFLRRLRFSLPLAWAAAFLFVVHPAHGESVSWIAAAFNDPPAATLLLLGLSAYAVWVTRGWVSMLLLTAVAYAAGLCLKESALSMLLLVPLVHWYLTPHDRLPARLTAWAIGLGPLIALTIGYFLLRKHLFGFAFGNYEGTRGVMELAPTFPSLALFYVRLLVWPFGMSPSYGLRYVPGWDDVRAWGGLIAVVALTIGVWIATRKSRPLRFAAFWTAFCIWPVFNIRSFRPEYLVHQRYLYLACLSICLTVAYLTWRWIQSGAARGVVVGLVVLIWSASNVMYNPSWKTDHNLWMRISEVDPGNAAGPDWLAAEARREGRFAESNAYIDKSIAVNPKSPHPYMNRAYLLHRDLKQPQEALPWFEKGISLHWEDRSPDPVAIARAMDSYALCLRDVGRFDDAIRQYVAAAELPPYLPEIASNAARSLLDARRGAEAYDVLARAIERNPDERMLVNRMVQLSAAIGRHDESIRWANVYIQQFPGDPDGPKLLAAARKAAGR